MEAATPQAVAANATFLAYAPPPPTPVKVCVVDTGVDLTTDAAPAVVERYSVFGGTTDDVGGSGLSKHGTLVAGVIASQLDGRDSVGIWPQARIVSVRVFAGSGGGTTTAAYLTALEKCRERGASVVNLSLSGLDGATGEDLARLEDRIATLRIARNINVVAGVGNTGGPVGFPARFAAVVGVGASDSKGTLCDFSSRGPGLDLSAPGCGVELSWPGGGTGIGQGTSYASPAVAAVVAALRAYQPELDAGAAEHLVLDAGGGQLDAAAAFRAAGLSYLVQSSAEAAPVSPGADNAGAVGNKLAALGVRSARVRVARYRRGVLYLRIAGIPDFGRAVFRIDSRTYVRQSGILRLETNRLPRRATVSIDVPEVGSTPPLRIRIRRDRRNGQRSLK
jgi:hypothetical protein